MDAWKFLASLEEKEINTTWQRQYPVLPGTRAIEQIDGILMSQLRTCQSSFL